MKEKIERYVENGLEGVSSSPMDPPHAFHLEGIEKVAFAEMTESLRALVSDHDKYIVVLDDFEAALIAFKNGSWVMTEAVSQKFRAFFHFMDHETTAHNAKEEKVLFPVLHKKLIAAGECSPGDKPTTAIDVMEDDHLKVLQTSCLVFNLIGIASRLHDETSRQTVCQIVYDQGREIVETMRLHIFKENEVLFPRAQKLISEEEFRFIARGMKRYEVD